MYKFLHRHVLSFLFYFIYLFLEKGEGREKERERKIYVRQKHQLAVSHIPRPGIKPATWACALTRNQTGDLSLCRMTPSHLSHTSQGADIRSHLLDKYLGMKWMGINGWVSARIAL